MIQDLFVDKDSAKLVDFILDFPEDYFSKKDIMKETGISFYQLRKAIQPFEKSGIIFVGKKIARATLYKVDTDNHIFKKLLDLDKAIAEAEKGVKL